MDRNYVLETIYSCVCSVLSCEIDALNEDSGFLSTFGWDSLAQVEIFCSVEEAFNIKFSNELIEIITSIGIYADYVMNILITNE